MKTLCVSHSVVVLLELVEEEQEDPSSYVHVHAYLRSVTYVCTLTYVRVYIHVHAYTIVLCLEICPKGAQIECIRDIGEVLYLRMLEISVF